MDRFRNVTSVSDRGILNLYLYMHVIPIIRRGNACLVKTRMIKTTVSMSICGNRFCVILRRHSRHIWQPRYPFSKDFGDQGLADTL